MIAIGLSFLLFAGLLALNGIGLTISLTTAAIITGVVFVAVGLISANGFPNRS